MQYAKGSPDVLEKDWMARDSLLIKDNYSRLKYSYKVMGEIAWIMLSLSLQIM